MATLSSHTLNGMDGTHAGGIAVTLSNLTTGARIFETKMDAGGRLSQELDLTGADPGDTYELVFATGPYWATRSSTDRPIAEIVLRFTMPDPDARYHMPIILNPHGYSCWSSS